MKNVKKTVVIIFGAIIGLVNGFFGGGGGMIAVPILSKYCSLEQKKSQATALFIILPLSLVSTIVYFCNNSVNLYDGWQVILGIVIGGAVGAILLNKLNNKVIKWIFIVLMLVAGIIMLFK